MSFYDNTQGIYQKKKYNLIQIYFTEFIYLPNSGEPVEFYRFKNLLSKLVY